MAEHKHTNFDIRLSKANLCALILLVGVLWIGSVVTALCWRSWFSANPPVDNVKSQTAREFIDPNTATVPSLQRLRGIGPVMAQRIVDYRNQHGPQAFKCLADLEKVRGIGPQTIKKNIEYLVFPSESKNERKQ